MATETSTDSRKNGRWPEELRTLWQHVLLRLTALYVVPLLLLVFFFFLQYRSLLLENRRVHLRALAEQQAATLDLFLSERLINLSNVINDPSFPAEPDHDDLAAILSSLQQTSDAFVELGVLDGDGRVLAYAGALPHLGERNYAGEDWFIRLREGQASHMITDIYRGFRDQPHFTIAVKHEQGDRYRVLRAVMSPERINRELDAGARDPAIQNALINQGGVFQVVEPSVGEPLTASPFRPGTGDRSGTSETDVESGEEIYGFAWLSTTRWAVIVSPSRGASTGQLFSELAQKVAILGLLFFLFGGVAIWFHARSTVQRLWEAQKTKEELTGQLVQAAKLASVGELAAGIAHEINNPLAIIAEEVGLLKDLMDPELGGGFDNEDLMVHLDTMHEAVFRGRDITRKLLGFVRQTDVRLEETNIHRILDDTAESVLGRDFTLSDVKIVRVYNADPPTLVTDRNQLAQVLINLIKNAVDAMEGRGTLTLRTSRKDGWIKLSITDTGCGMSREQLERIFMPFFTTKDPGKGTGLGLSVSHGIVESLGGKLYVDSKIGVGSTFTIELPPEPA